MTTPGGRLSGVSKLAAARPSMRAGACPHANSDSGHPGLSRLDTPDTSQK